tara:strand:+ start:80 stop:523 length:444 start_codon:yes stop_codon:yes gene_type:complete
MRQYYQGKYKVKNYQKYKGDPTNVIYRSSWELKFLKYCDLNDNVLEFGSEEVIVPYMSPLDNRIHRYFPDFYIKVREKNGKIKKYLIEIKPKKQVIGPSKNPKRKTKNWINEVKEYAKNQAKWKAAREYCEDRLLEFKILTEDELGV